MSFVVCLAPGGGLEPPCPCIAVCLLSLVLGCSCSFPGWEGLAPLCVLCFVAPAPHGGLISVMILSLRPGTRQDPLKNSSGLLAALGGSQSLGAFADTLLRKLATRLGRLLEGGVGLEPTCSGLQPGVYPFGHPPFVAGRAPPVKQTSNFKWSQNTRVSPCTRVFCICRRSIRLR